MAAARVALWLVATTALVAITALVAPAAHAQPGPSGGPMDPAQWTFDVRAVDLALTVDPAARTLAGTASQTVRIVWPTDVLVFDLDDALAVSRVDLRLRDGDAVVQRTAPFERTPGRLRIALGRTAQPGERLRATIHYGGAPHVATRPPWDGGITWSTTADGQPWVAMSVQGYGADVWFPVKDHPSDEPDSLTVALTVPDGLRGVANGRYLGRTMSSDGTVTDRWAVTHPINAYGVSFGVAPYTAIRRIYEGPTGTQMPVTLWALPERVADMTRQADGFLDALAFLERTFGPYPWRADGYQVLHTPYLGMEHQSLIAYGSTFQNNAYGFDWLHFHELAHEWWANLGTAPDWRDFWVHESFATYAEALYAEDLARRAGNARPDTVYLRYLDETRTNVLNAVAVAPRESRTTLQMYVLPDGRFNGDIYFKGAWVLHTLRYLIQDDEAFLAAFRRLLYPTPASEAAGGGTPARFVGTADVLGAFRRAAGRDLSGVFEVYLRQPALPRLAVTRSATQATLRWIVPDAAGDAVFDVPVEVAVDGATHRVEMPGGVGTVSLPRRTALGVDPHRRILFDRAE